MATTAVVVQGRPNDHPLGPTGTVGLCIDKNNNIVLLIDAGDPWNGTEILEKLGEFYVRTGVTHVVITHGHLDHCANLGLFPEATQIMDADIAVRKNGKVEYSVVPRWPFAISGNIEIMQLSGHTAADTIVTVREKSKRISVFSGDLVEDLQEFLNFQENQLELLTDEDSDDLDLLLSQEYIFSSGDFIFPGHGPSFENPYRLYFLFFSFWRRFMC